MVGKCESVKVMTCFPLAQDALLKTKCVVLRCRRDNEARVDSRKGGEIVISLCVVVVKGEVVASCSRKRKECILLKTQRSVNINVSSHMHPHSPVSLYVLVKVICVALYRGRKT